MTAEPSDSASNNARNGASEDTSENTSGTGRGREWVALGITIAFSAFFIWRSWVDGQRVFPVILVLGLAVLIWWSWPGQQKGPHVSHQQALTEAGPDGAVIYWRPG